MFLRRNGGRHNGYRKDQDILNNSRHLLMGIIIIVVGFFPGRRVGVINKNTEIYVKRTKKGPVDRDGPFCIIYTA